jgi:hypothetical protein
LSAEGRGKLDMPNKPVGKGTFVKTASSAGSEIRN